MENFLTVDRTGADQRWNSAKNGRHKLNRLTRLLAALVVVVATAAACSTGDTSEGRESLTVFAAASLTEAFTDIAAAFEEANPDVSVALNFSGSQRLRVQLEHGAKADVFASANEYQMALAKVSGVLAGDAVDFASNTMVVIVFNPGGDDSTHSDATSRAGSAAVSGPVVQSLEDLARNGIKLALAQPEVPAGTYARNAIETLARDPGFGPEWLSRVTDNIVTLEPNVRNVLQKVSLGEVDAGVVYASDVLVASNLAVIPVPDDASVVAKYPIVPLKNSSQPAVAEEFIRFVRSAEGQAILRRHGFGPPLDATNSWHRSTPLGGLVKQRTDLDSTSTNYPVEAVLRWHWS